MSDKKVKILNQLLSEIENHIPFKDKRNDLVSKSDIGWQLDHSLKVFNLVCESLLKSNPNEYKGGFNKWRLLFFTLGYFPRGKVKAPKFVRPPEIITTEDIKQQLNLANKNLEQLSVANKNTFFKHFIFKNLNKKHTFRFLEIHTNHHLKIVNDIMK